MWTSSVRKGPIQVQLMRCIVFIRAQKSAKSISQIYYFKNKTPLSYGWVQFKNYNSNFLLIIRMKALSSVKCHHHRIYLSFYLYHTMGCSCWPNPTLHYT